MGKNEHGKSAKTLNPGIVAIGVVIVAMAGFIAWLLVGSGSGGEFDDQARDEYIAQCVSQSGQEDLCSCSYDKLQQSLSYSEFQELDERSKAGQTTESDNELLTSIVFTCASENQQAENP